MRLTEEDVKQYAREGNLVTTSMLNTAGIQPSIPCPSTDCSAPAGESCFTPSGWHYSRRDALVKRWKEE